jgi:hypothetical protein
MFLFTVTGQDLIKQLYKKASVNFIKDVRKSWSRSAQIVNRGIITSQLSGRKGSMGLNRKSGNAARALNSRTAIQGGDVVQRVFLAKNNPAHRYLPIHDKSREAGLGDFAKGIINHPGGTPYIVTDKGAKWLKKDGVYPKSVRFTKPHNIQIPVRTTILETLRKEGGRMRIKSLDEVLQSYAVR